MNHLQASLPGLCPIADAVEQLSTSGAEARGAVFTRREVVEFMLDLAGYVPSRELHAQTILEPSFGAGDFLFPVVRRLLTSAKSHNISLDHRSLCHCIRAVELHGETFAATRAELISVLRGEGVQASESVELAQAWLLNSDYLLTRFDSQGFDFVVGNPPYVRQELIPDALIRAYRDLFATVYDRADLYVPFIEKSLALLKPQGCLAFICSDRWMKNRYGSKLRSFVSRSFRLRFYVDMVNTDAFNAPVIAYPAITVISRERPGRTRLARRPEISQESLKELRDELLGATRMNGAVSEAEGIVNGEDPWLLETSDQLTLVRRLESCFPVLQETGCQVGIGVATGADKVFIGGYDELDVEPDRKLPLVQTKDIQSGVVNWRGLGVINPFKDDGGLVDLAEYPRLKAYLLGREAIVRARNVAHKNPNNWYRTIDRIYPELVTRPKLLIPDIKGTAHIVFEKGLYYPHHNLYYITSDRWELRALRAVLMSGIARLFVGIYSTVMHGGFLRFQAQYLRRIRLPFWEDVQDDIRALLIEAGESGEMEACNKAVADLYNLSVTDQIAIALNSGVKATGGY